MSDVLAVGLMSGTSLDGVSAALVRLSGPAPDVTLVAFHQEPYNAGERGQIIDAIARGGARELAVLHVALAERFAGAVLQLLAGAKTAPRQLAFVASHGQTIWHEPGRATLQIGDPAVLAERLGVPVVSDFRSRDVAAGGQGAPLVPLADVMLFGDPQHGRLLLNIGGMANVTWVPRRGVVEGALAFDTGPGVAVIDAVVRRLDPDAPYDRDGERARRGRPAAKVLEALLTDAFFAQAPPKSTGRETFGIAYAERLIERVREAGGADNDAVATGARRHVHERRRTGYPAADPRAERPSGLPRGVVRPERLHVAVPGHDRDRSSASISSFSTATPRKPSRSRSSAGSP